MSKKLIEHHVRISQLLGSQIAHVQGGGGNTSVKLDDETLLIKPSGFFLREITIDQPGVYVSYQPVIEYLDRDHNHITNERENEFTSLIDTSTKGDEGKKASIETSLHALIKRRYIAHTHSVYANVFTCAVNGKALLEAVLGESVAWLDYAAPGLTLARDFYRGLNTLGDSKVIFLKNHGIVVAADSADELELIYFGVEKKLQDYLFQQVNLNFSARQLVNDGLHLPIPVGEHIQALFNQSQLVKHLFPDSVVFGDAVKFDTSISGEAIYRSDGMLTFRDIPLRKAQVLHENLLAMNYILFAHQRLGMSSEYLSPQDISYILGMEREKHRKSLLK